MKKMPKRAKKESTWGSGKLDQKQKHKEQSTRRSIVQILEQLRAMSESKMLGCNPDKKISGDERSWRCTLHHAAGLLLCVQYKSTAILYVFHKTYKQNTTSLFKQCVLDKSK